jgi:thiol-disulfide isomerase/thioredoxin
MSLIFFYGTECPHCHAMVPLIEKLEHAEHVKVERLEVWHDDKNLAKLEGYDQGKCGGVPYFYNTET